MSILIRGGTAINYDHSKRADVRGQGNECRGRGRGFVASTVGPMMPAFVGA
jgi:hypothetical protein